MHCDMLKIQDGVAIVEKLIYPIPKECTRFCKAFLIFVWFILHRNTIQHSYYRSFTSVGAGKWHLNSSRSRPSGAQPYAKWTKIYI